jgi:alkyl hydroperoxide reductase subunit AhpC
LGQKAIERAGLAEAVGQAADAIVITDPDGVIQFVTVTKAEVRSGAQHEPMKPTL